MDGAAIKNSVPKYTKNITQQKVNDHASNTYINKYSI